MATFSVEQFLSTVSSKGLARENRFEVILPEQLTGDFPVSLLCESTSLPQMSVVTKQQRLFGPTYNRAATNDYGGAGLQMVFLVDSDMKVKKYFDDWMHRCVAQSEFTAKYLKDYAFDIIINQLNEKNEVTYTIKLIEAFPTASGPMTLSQSAQDTFHRLPVTIAYRYWETDSISNSQTFASGIGTVSTAITPTAQPRSTFTPDPGKRNTASDYIRQRDEKLRDAVTTVPLQRPGEGF